MKKGKTLIAILLVVSLVMGLGACSLFPEPEEKPPLLVRTPLPQDDAARLAYYNLLLEGVAQAMKCTVETSYGMDDIEVGNETLKAASGALKAAITAWLAHNEEYTLPDEAFFLPPALTMDEILAQDAEEGAEPEGLKLQVRDVLEDIEIKNRLENLQKDIDEGKNTNMVDADGDKRRQYVLDQMGVSAKDEAEKYYQIDITLDPAAVELLLLPGDKAAILEELSKSADYLLVEDYTLTPKELTLYARVDKATDHFTELRITEKADLETTVKGVGTLAGEGEAPVTLTLTKTVKYTGFEWPEDAKEE